ncbi:MAG TPA: three-Cys-motif partner protein TcmP [Gemmatimonadaceae bacterium]|jgi:three-Cys-motif partner protein|nr:three-Cys-motif partner protein TcmP [Gemmatimonadaceae bacterium]
MDDEAKQCREDDGLYLPEIKRHSLEKIRLHNRYSRIFADGMRKKWPQLAYVGLYSGAGRARVVDTGEIVETSALAVLRQPTPFTKYVFVDRDEQCTNALATRIASLGTTQDVSIITGDVNEKIWEVRETLPSFDKSKGLLSFCFVDPFDLQFRFDSIRALSDFKMDFLVLLMLGVDGRRNFKQYLQDPSSTRIDDLIDCPDWRTQFAGSHDRNVIRFLLRKFDEAMTRLGYLSTGEELYHPVNVHNMRVLQYILTFYSKSQVGQKFWRESRASLSPQLGLPL